MDKKELIEIAEKRGEFELAELLEEITLTSVRRGTLPVRQVFDQGVVIVPAILINSRPGNARSQNGSGLPIRRFR